MGQGKSLALFDFDGTLTIKDSFLEMIKFQKGIPAFYLGFSLLLPILLLYKLKIIANWKAKEMVLRYFFSGNDASVFRKKSHEFGTLKIEPMLRPEAIARLKWHQQQGHHVLIVSASGTLWIEDWAKTLGVEVIGTNLEEINGKITGRLKGKNCFGPEKVSRIKAYIDLSDFEKIYVYGDSNGDKEMLELGTDRFYRRFA